MNSTTPVIRVQPVKRDSSLRGTNWRGGRVVEGAALEMLFRGNFNEGSNPSLSVLVFSLLAQATESGLSFYRPLTSVFAPESKINQT
jgi:hypothetical protein